MGICAGGIGQLISLPRPGHADPCQEIVRSRAPFWLVYDGDGKSVAGKISPEFLEWAKQNKLPEDAARNEQLSVLPAQIFLLAVTGDTRGRPILREGLASTNYLVRAFSSDGLALLQDYDSVPMIIKAAEQTPFELRFRVAESLVLFDDPKASAAAEKLIPQKGLLEYLRKRAKELGPRGVFSEVGPTNWIPDDIAVYRSLSRGGGWHKSVQLFGCLKARHHAEAHRPHLSD